METHVGHYLLCFAGGVVSELGFHERLRDISNSAIMNNIIEHIHYVERTNICPKNFVPAMEESNEKEPFLKPIIMIKLFVFFS